MRDIKTPTPPTSLGGRLEENEDHLIDHSGGNFTKKSEKKKHKKLFQSSNNGHNNASNSSSSHHSSSNSGVRLLSATSKSENGLHSASTNGTETSFGGSSGGGGQSPQTQQQQQEQSDSESLPNFVRDNFVGKTVFRTKCLECETSTYRSDKFINIDIPLTFDDDLSETMSNGLLSDDNSSNSLRSGTVGGQGHGGGGGHGNNTLSVADLFLKQIMASETLRENNKYLCAECSRLNEAQRSVQYELLPKILVLQLKRFTAASNKSAFMSKINDFIPTPFTMNCFCTQCMPPDMPPQPPGESSPTPPKHHYRLFAVIMHLGATLASGHYIAYVRASIDLTGDYSQCPRAIQMYNSERQKSGGLLGGGGSNGNNGHSSAPATGKKGIMKFFSKTSTNSSSNSLHSLGTSNGKDCTDNVGNGSTGGGGGGAGPCKSSQCCSMTRVLGQLNHRIGESSTHRFRHRSQESLESNSNRAENGPGGGGGGGSDSLQQLHNGGNVDMDTDLWLECDDENISVITRRQFEEELNSKQSSTTPYLLFYERV